jgi:hypothetical protein
LIEILVKYVFAASDSGVYESCTASEEVYGDDDCCEGTEVQISVVHDGSFADTSNQSVVEHVDQPHQVKHVNYICAICF